MCSKQSIVRCVVGVLSIVGAAVTCVAENRTMTGSGNNVANPNWGVTNARLLRVCPEQYADHVQAPCRMDLASPRVISNAVHNQTAPTLNNRRMSDWVWQWGQFIDHDFGITDTAGTDKILIPVPKDDPNLPPGVNTIVTSRTFFDPATGTGPGNPREQINQITAFVDGSMVYGSDDSRSAWLRSGVGGRLKTTDSPVGPLMPYNDGSQGNAMGNSAAFFVAGDVRANEQIGLTSIHTLFVREHNRLCDELAALNPGWSDEQIYQRARKIVGAIIERITYEDWAPALFGPNPLPAYAGYDPDVNAGMATEFTTAAFRIGHTLISGAILRVDDNGNPWADGPVDLLAAFFQPNILAEQGGLEPILKGLATGQAQEFDPLVVTDLRNFLFGTLKDLPAINIVRGREHGLGDFNSIRVAYGLPAYASFGEITSDASLAAALASVYARVNDIDPWTGMLCEDHVAPGSVGETMRTIILDQLVRSRDGDRFYWENDPEMTPYATFIQASTLGAVIKRNSHITRLQDDVFFVPEAGDLNGDRRIDSQDLAVFLGTWGACPGSEVCVGDLNHDGLVNATDLAMMLAGWGV